MTLRRHSIIRFGCTPVFAAQAVVHRAPTLGASLTLAVASIAFGSGSPEVLFKSTDASVTPPGFPAGSVVWSASTPFTNLTIADDGTVVFNGRFADNDPANPPVIVAGGSGVLGNDRAIFYGSPGNWSLVAQSGVANPLPGGPAGFTFNTATGTNGLNTSAVSISPSGAIAISGTISYAGVTSATDTAMWTGVPGAMTLVAMKGSQAGSETGDVVYSSSLSIGFPRLNNAGQVIFHSNLTGTDVVPPNANAGVTGTNMGVFVTGPTGASTFVRRGFPAPPIPGLPAGTMTNAQDSGGFVINGSGQSVYLTRLSNDSDPASITSSNDRALVSDVGGGPLRMVAREGDAIPGMPGMLYGPNTSGSESTFTIAGQGLTNAGTLLFQSTVSGPGITTANNQMMLTMAADGTVSKLLQKGDTVSGLGSDTIALFQNASFGITNSGFWAANVQVTAPATSSDEVLIVGTSLGAAPMVAAREGMEVPGAAGVTLGGFWNNTSLLISDSGRVVFHGTLAGSGVDTTNNQGLFAWDAKEGLRMIMRKGDTELLGTAITNIAVAGALRTGECSSMAFTPSGWLALNLSYSGGTALVRWYRGEEQVGCNGDINGNGTVDGQDLSILLGAWGGELSSADLNDDGQVNGQDLAYLLGAWGPCQ
jgi:hypothetical protein